MREKVPSDLWQHINDVDYSMDMQKAYRIDDTKKLLYEARKNPFIYFQIFARCGFTKEEVLKICIYLAKGVVAHYCGHKGRLKNHKTILRESKIMKNWIKAARKVLNNNNSSNRTEAYKLSIEILDYTPLLGVFKQLLWCSSAVNEKECAKIAITLFECYAIRFHGSYFLGIGETISEVNMYIRKYIK